MVFLENIKKRLTKKGSDKGIYTALTILAVFGVVMIGTTSIGTVSKGGPFVALKNLLHQSVFVIAGLVAMFIATKKYDVRKLNKSNLFILFVGGIFLMAFCLVFRGVKGSHAWIRLGGITVQPAEFMKIIMILVYSYYFSESDLAFKIKHKFKSRRIFEQFKKKKRLNCLIIPFIMLLITMFVGIVLQKDFGTTLIISLICFIIFMATPRPYYKVYKKRVIFAMVVGAILLILGGSFLLKPHQIGRFKIWLNPLDNYHNNAYQLTNSLIAFSNGKIFGNGFGLSTQKYGYIPEAQNDFIAAVIYEELGIFGLGLIVIPTCYIIFKLLKYSELVKSHKERLILIGVASYFILHLFINLGGISGLIPMTGVPLLLVSAGGSSAMASLTGIGIAQGIIAKYNKEKMLEDGSI